MNVQIDEINPDILVMSLGGDLDMSVSPEVRKVLLPLFRENVSHIIVDLKDVGYIDSSGIATFVESLQMSRKTGIRFSLAGACPKVEAIFDLAHLKSIFEMSPDVAGLIEGEKGR